MNVAYVRDDEYFGSQKPSFLSNLTTKYSKYRVFVWIILFVLFFGVSLLIILSTCAAKEKVLQKAPGDTSTGLSRLPPSMQSSTKASSNSVNANGGKSVSATSKGSAKSSKKQVPNHQGVGISHQSVEMLLRHLNHQRQYQYQYEPSNKKKLMKSLNLFVLLRHRLILKI